MEKIHIGIGASEADHRVIEPADEPRGAKPSGVGWIVG
jgi:hypothetical protein